MAGTFGFAVVAATVAIAFPARADDVFFRVPMSAIRIENGEIPKHEAPSNWEMTQLIRPYAVIEGGEAFIVSLAEIDQPDVMTWMPVWSATESVLAARVPAGKSVSGWLYVPNADWSGMVPLKFTLADEAATPHAKRDFYRAKQAYYERLRREGGPGTAYFRRLASDARLAIDAGPDDPNRAERLAPPGRELADTYSLFTGGRAVSENLQLYRELPPAPRGAGTPPPAPDAPEEMVPTDSIAGITLGSVDWAKIPADAGAAEFKPDALAAAIPADQHAVFFPSFQAIVMALDETRANGLPIFRSLSNRSEDARVIQRYERQLLLPLTGISRLLGSRVVKSVAVTGSDPYFPTGTDVAVVFEPASADALGELLLAQMKIAAGASPGAAASDGNADGVRYQGFVSPDRSVCAYLATIGGNVVVTNSLVQIRRLAAVQSAKAPALGSLDEYRYFRTRYAPGAAGETGFAFISDATIRRWCSAAWRIGGSRRLRAGAILADLTAAHMGELIKGVPAAAVVTSDIPMRTIGELSLTPTGARSSVYGGTAFLTPIAELDLREVTKSEATSYGRWRDGYQRNWSWAFDPIGVSISVAPERLRADLTVLPLILGTEYRHWLSFIQGASIAADAGDRHGALAHAVVAMNTQSPAAQQAGNMALMMAPGVKVEPLGWLGKSVALYADADPFWTDMLAANDGQRFLEEGIERLPIALHAEVESAMKLTAFLTALRAFIDQSAPGMSVWENRTHNNQPYVVVGMAQAGGGGQNPFDRLRIYYAATPKALVISPNEDVLKRSIDRMAAAKAPTGPAWLGTSAGLQFTREGLELLDGPGRDSRRSAERRSAWANLPILNEWKRRYPDQDPLKVHAAWWGTALGGAGEAYSWNDRFQTMESSVYGHPGEPKMPEQAPGVLRGISAGNLGLTFENGGLRARATVDRAEPGK